MALPRRDPGSPQKPTPDTRARKNARKDARQNYDAQPVDQRRSDAAQSTGKVNAWLQHPQTAPPSQTDFAIEHAHRSREGQHAKQRAFAKAQRTERIGRAARDLGGKARLFSMLVHDLVQGPETPESLRREQLEERKKALPTMDRKVLDMIDELQQKSGVPETKRLDVQEASIGKLSEAFKKSLDHKLQSGALWALDKVSRPLYGFATTTDELVKGHKVTTALSEGAKPFYTEKNKRLFGDVLKSAGAPKFVQATIGTGADFFLDPANLVSFGTVSAARKLGKEALTHGLKAGLSEADALAAARKVYDGGRVDVAGKVFDGTGLPKNRGVTAGVRVKAPKLVKGKHAPVRIVRTPLEKHSNGVFSAKILGGLKQAGKATTRPLTHKRPAGADALDPDKWIPRRGGRLQEGVETASTEVMKGKRPSDIHPMDWEFLRTLTSQHRAARGQMERSAMARAGAYADYIRKEGITAAEQEKIVHHIEDGTVDHLDDRLGRLARAVQRDLQQAGETEVAANIRKTLVGGDVTDPKLPAGYFPRYLRKHADKQADTYRAPGSEGQKVSGTSLNQRVRQERLALQPDHVREQYLLGDIPQAGGRRLLEHASMVVKARTLDRLAALGKKINSVDDVHDLHDLDQLVVKTPRGYSRLVADRGLEPTTERVEKLIDEAVKRGADVRLIPKREFDEAFRLLNRGHVAPTKPGRAFDKAQGKMKTGLTVINPGYHGTNLVGDTFNARLGGARTGSFVRAWQLLQKERSADHVLRDLDLSPQERKLFERGGEKEFYKGLERDADDAEVVFLAREHGAIQRGFAGHELHALMDTADAGKTGKRRPMELIRRVNERREDLIRLASFHSALKRGLDPQSAADWVNKHHFDYGDITETERVFMRRAIPFYTFWSRNLPLQVEALFRSPGVFANVNAAREESFRAAGMDPEDVNTLPKYAQQGAPFMLPFKVGGLPVSLYPKLPLTDLNSIDPNDIGNQIMQRANPLVKVPAELATGFNFFFKDKHDDARVQAPGFLGDEAVRSQVNDAIEGLFGVKNAVTMEVDKKTGDMVPAWSWKVDLLNRQMPILNLVSSMMTEKTVNQQGNQRKLSALGYLLGPRPAQIDPTAIETGQLFDKLNAAQAEADDLKDRVPLAKRPKKGESWGGRIGELNAKARDLMQEIAQAQRDGGYAAPAFGNMLPDEPKDNIFGIPAPKPRRSSSKKKGWGF